MNFIKDIKSVLKTTDKIKWLDIDKIVIDPEIEGIFIQKEAEIQNIANNMIENQKNNKSAFDPAHPIVLVSSKEHPELNNINADGHTRYKAAKRAGLSKVAIIYKEFSNREELLKFVYEQQLLRRNLSENEIFNAWSALNRLTNENGKKAKSDNEIASELKVSRRQVAKMKIVEKKSDPEMLQKVKAGKLSINKAYNTIKETAPADDFDIRKNKKLFMITRYHFEAFEYVMNSLIYGKSVEELSEEFYAMARGEKTLNQLKQSFEKWEKENSEQNKTK